MSYYVTLISALALLLVPLQATANTELGIAAIVNDDIITTTDVQDRVQLVHAMAGMPNTQEVFEQLAAQTMRNLVDEYLQKQEADRLNILIEAKEIDQSINRIEQGRGRPPGSLTDALLAQGLSIESFRAQMAAQIRWQKILQRKVSRDVNVNDDEIKLAQQKMAQGRSELEWKVSIINVPVHSPEEEGDVQKTAELYARQLAQGQGIGAIEAQLKNDPAASVQIGKWLQPTALREEVAGKLARMQIGQVTPPSRTFDGYQIVRLEEKRTVAVKPTNAEIAMKEILLTLGERASTDEVDLLLQIAQDIRMRPGTCRDTGIAGMVDFDGLDIEIEYVRTELDRMNETIRALVAPLSIGEVAEPFATPEGIRLLMLCEKIEQPLPLPEEEWVREQLMQEKMSLAAAKFMRNLRRQSFVDMRI